MDAAGSSTFTAAATSTQVMPNRSGRRIEYSITNYGAVVVYLNLSNNQPAQVGYGVPLYPGQTIFASSSNGIPCWQGSISAIDATATGTLAVWERVQL